ncbi:putative Rho termination factor [Helianthus annuus]|uniref:Rho termination factor n=1 Tax=Helianthus annuus TaxID=4232 RepID=A0A251V196_HELAN|nr:rho-N domain-containing protein 1, chloroplastic [Helianthus annuus]KAF5810529.1 putative Rho termination factor [Helianthus annuus]KAJ0581331.1 putative Rho termination factor [Helianthus annuus]KAJ0589267.1 putative Rho termination factor [Helianthus annuus]KAJ0597278.1 putative Rho termination factor [Helianthus annuus]KAJ0757958.1 putative Rho termination factor [Helianthus annuus]
MLPASHLISHGVPAGHGTPEGRCLRAFTVSPCSFCNNNKRFPQVKIVPSGNLTCASRGTTSFICNANSSGQRRNPDFSRQNRQGYSRNKNRNHEDRDAIDGFEDSEVFSSKNGQSFLSSSPPKFQSTAAPGPREREIVEIFRKVQAQLRERAAQKEEKKVEDSQGHNKQNETVDSLLKLLRKHSVQHGKSTTTSRNNRDFVLDNQPEQNNSFLEDKSPKDSNNRVKHEVQATEAQSVRPVSNFQKRSPVSGFKYRPLLTGEESFTPGPSKRKEPEAEPTPEVKIKTVSEPEVENEAFVGFDEGSDDDIEEIADEVDDSEEANVIEDKDLSSMKLVELREVAKSRGIKGFSKLKKAELLELLTS